MEQLTRRAVIQTTAALGIASVTFQRAIAFQVVPQEPSKPGQPPQGTTPRPRRVTAEMIAQAEWLAGISLTDEQRSSLVGAMNQAISRSLRAQTISAPNELPPAFAFIPQTEIVSNAALDDPTKLEAAIPQQVNKPATDDDLAFASVATLARLLRTKQVSSLELTKLALARLEKYNPFLLCVVTRLDDLALQQAKQADAEIARGEFRSVLHGIPWGAKDLIAYPGYPTTWGAAHYRNQTIDSKATVAQKLDDARAVLCAKLTLGALALGDRWFGGMTRNPWNNQQGSSGSSAGSASAVAAGLLPFAIGSETLGSIISPSTRCGVTGLRPTFGRVSRAGCMTLAWTLDKLGPLARTAEDCALILGVIHGADAADPAAVTKPFSWPNQRPLKELRVGYFPSKQEANERDELRVLRELGVKLVEIELPRNIPTDIVSTILDAESAAAFDDLTLEGITEGIGPWDQTFRRGRFITAVDYLRAMRLRSKLMQAMAKLFERVDCYIGGNDLVHTNLTGHPTISFPNGPAPAGLGTPRTSTMTGSLYGEASLLALAQAYQLETGFHLARPKLDQLKPIDTPR